MQTRSLAKITVTPDHSTHMAATVPSRSAPTTTARIQPATARIQPVTTRVQPATARVQSSRVQPARVPHSTARVQPTPSRPVPTASARVQPAPSRTVPTASARVQPTATSPAAPTAPARIQQAPTGPVRKAAHATGKKEDISMLHLPITIREEFRLRFVPFLRELAGSIGPWDTFSEDQITYVWYATFPDFNSQIEDGLLWVVTKLVSHGPLPVASLIYTL
jgi:hypothetical protein